MYTLCILFQRTSALSGTTKLNSTFESTVVLQSSLNTIKFDTTIARRLNWVMYEAKIRERELAGLRHTLMIYEGTASVFSGESLKANLHGTILSHATSVRHAYDTKKL